MSRRQATQPALTTTNCGRHCTRPPDSWPSSPTDDTGSRECRVVGRRGGEPRCPRCLPATCGHPRATRPQVMAQRAEASARVGKVARQQPPSARTAPRVGSGRGDLLKSGRLVMLASEWAAWHLAPCSLSESVAGVVASSHVDKSNFAHKASHLPLASAPRFAILTGVAALASATNDTRLGNSGPRGACLVSQQTC